jgi:hypothetical protein
MEGAIAALGVALGVVDSSVDAFAQEKAAKKEPL